MVEINEFLELCYQISKTKILFAEIKIKQIVEEIMQNQKIKALIGECLSNFNKEQEFDNAFTVLPSGRGGFVLPQEEFKIIAISFCILSDINCGKLNFDDLMGNYFVDDFGVKDFDLFVEKVIIPFRNLVAEVFDVEKCNCNEENLNSDKDEFKPVCVDEDKLDDVFEDTKNIANQLFTLINNKSSIKDEAEDSLYILSALIAACDKKDFSCLYGLALGVKYALKKVKPLRFITKELIKIVEDNFKRD